MASATVIHFGSDDCHRVPVLRHLGYEVRESDSLDRLRLDLGSNEDVDVVMVEEGGRRATERAAAMVRQYSGAPLILFRRSNAPLSVKRFDRVYSPSAPVASWLFETAVLVEESLRLQAETKRLTSKAKPS